MNLYETNYWNRFSDKKYEIFINKRAFAHFLETSVNDQFIHSNYSCYDPMEYMESFSCKKTNQMSKSQLESTNESLEPRFCLQPKGYLKKMISTKGKSYAILNESS
ncbi:hypothetical protein CWI39_0047p0020 [Hamiltosporidium magnivora]|uniref:Uncharacterized protein n=1 Tax=Hamiltosporidium magnivora TaxID=148818 RepID=A0A4Q9LQ72_9MICR|nr:hypothetical protein CWI39_0047p0020 [Hamiltosporidium magnivora]